MIKEVWKVLDFIGYYDYAISNWGRVKSLNYKRTGKERILKQQKTTGGYLSIYLSNNKTPKFFQVHRLVALAFLPNPDNLQQINHKDEDKTNNCVWNLEWCTAKYNTNYGTGHKRCIDKLINGKTSKPVNQYTKDGTLIAVYPSIQEAERQTKCNHSKISSCCNGKRKTHKGYLWKYAE